MRDGAAAFVWVSLFVLSGCARDRPQGEPYPYPSQVGDQGRVSFEEVVVSLPLRGATGPYQNLHVAVTASINPVDPGGMGPFFAEGIVRRTEARVAARLVQALSALGGQSIDRTDELRGRVAAEAQGAVDEAMRPWKRASEYRVEVSVTRLYWTDPSVGAPAPRRRFPWD